MCRNTYKISVFNQTLLIFYRNDGGYNDGGDNRGGKKPIPNEPPYTAFVGNLPDGIVQGDVEIMFKPLKVRTLFHECKEDENNKHLCKPY